ncbi:hypothetical protein M0811_10691 [Anaeramoeba ignava]|uniref:Uncharacterized protein n=1 Tax=Anaeramoeba ignava TaxID=1746090 RepID=A0A9Q0LDC3_ANAIG|nr:hypothetical protein M0811_10691 [Anaeramoeba ignava]
MNENKIIEENEDYFGSFHDIFKIKKMIENFNEKEENFEQLKNEIQKSLNSLKIVIDYRNQIFSFLNEKIKNYEKNLLEIKQKKAELIYYLIINFSEEEIKKNNLEFEPILEEDFIHKIKKIYLIKDEEEKRKKKEKTRRKIIQKTAKLLSLENEFK